MLIIVGLGNPGKEYENTFHNMGFRAVDALAEKIGKNLKKAECNALTVTFSKKGDKIVLAKPLTFMNSSGEAVKGLVAKYKAKPEEVVVIYDDIDLPRHTLRARASGSAGTHNGMRSIVSLLGTEGFKRIRIGIGRGPGDLADYVLSDVPSCEKEAFGGDYLRIAEALEAYISDRDFEALMRKLNF